MATIEIARFVKDYGALRVLHEVDLHIADGEFVVLLGPSGCGKSTMLRMIAGLEDITEGTLSIGGEVMNLVAAQNRNVAMVFQNYALYPHMTAYDNIAFGLRRLGTPREEIARRVRHVAGLLALDDHLHKKPRHLSGGQQQRVAMGRAMIKTPKVFLFDEPLSNLDATLREQLRIEIKKLHMLLKTTTVFVTHDQLEAMTLADKIVVMRNGRIEQIGTPRDIYFAPNSRFVAGFVGTPAMNMIPVRVTATMPSVQLDADGFSLTIHPARFPALTPRQEAVLGIRPRDLHRTRQPTAANLAAQVVLNEMMGSETLMQIRLGGFELMMLVDDRDVAPVGGTIDIAISDDDIHLFDATTGATLTAPKLSHAV